jgi:hypothetical protein
MEVLKHWVGRMKPDSVLEHGAGLNSTPYLRGLGIKVLTIEDEVRWRKDIDAVSYEQWDMTEVFDLVLVDGPGEQRARVVEAVMITEAYCILEHDAEAWSEDELALRMRLCERYGYSFQQESSLNPETAVMLLKDEGS